MVFLFGLYNAVEIVGHLVTKRMRSSLTNGEFVGMADYVVELFHDGLRVPL